MKKLANKEQISLLSEYPKGVIETIQKVMVILNQSYGVYRDIDNDLGGYVLIAENIVDIEVLKQDKLQGLIPEYTDVIEYSQGVNWTYIKELKRYEVRFCVYKDTRRGGETYIPRSLDVTELELIELIKESISRKVFSDEFIDMLKQELK